MCNISKTALCVWWMTTLELICALEKHFFIHIFLESCVHKLFLVFFYLSAGFWLNKTIVEQFFYCFEQKSRISMEFIKFLLIFISIHLSYHFVSLWGLFPRRACWDIRQCAVELTECVEWGLCCSGLNKNWNEIDKKLLNAFWV